VESVHENIPINDLKRKEIERWTNWILRVSGAHPSFGRDQTELRDYIIPNSVTDPEIGQFHHRGCTSGLNQLHSLGIVHGNLKPSNILVSFPKGGHVLTFPLSGE